MSALDRASEQDDPRAKALREVLHAQGRERGDLREAEYELELRIMRTLRDVRRVPGVTMAEAADLLGLNSRTQAYHLLEQARRRGV